MNLLNIIRDRSASFPPGFDATGIQAVVLHIERAEAYWERAKREADEVLFTDVIYRTNQAFEGALKEAYSVLANKDATHTTPHKIEEHLTKAGLFKERVLSAFTNYRTEWRNKSTHDYKLFFSEQEALLAINSVSAFCVILLEQIITKANESYERARAQQLSEKVKASIFNFASLGLFDRAIALLVKSYEFMEIPQTHPVRESELLGLLTGFIEAVDPSVRVASEVVLNPQTLEHADLILSDGYDKIVVELKRVSLHREIGVDAQRQLLRYMKLAETNHGIFMTIDEKTRKGEALTQNSLFDTGPVITIVRPVYSFHDDH